MTFLVIGRTSVREEFETLGAAIARACDLIKGGLAVRRIEGSDGLIMEQPDVELECSRRSDAARTPRQQGTADVMLRRSAKFRGPSG